MGKLIKGSPGSLPFVVASLGLLAVLFTLRGTTAGYVQEADPGPRVFPIALGLALILLGAFEAVRQIMSAPLPEGEPPREIAGARWLSPVLLLPAGLAIYLVLIPWLGFLPSTFLLAGGMIRALGDVWWKAGLYSAGLVLAVYLLFVRIFKVPLPEGAWF